MSFDDGISRNNFNKICRTCFDRNNLQPMHVTNADLSVPVLFTYCTKLEFNNEDELPKQMCSKCINELTQAYLFIKKCITNDTILKTCLTDDLNINKTVGVDQSLIKQKKCTKRTRKNIPLKLRIKSGRCKSGTYKKICLIPCCSNTDTNSNKIFCILPSKHERRKRWFEAIYGDQAEAYYVRTSELYVCEDHFILENDAENWMQYKIMSTVLRLKPDVVPHLNLNSPKSSSAEDSQLLSASVRFEYVNVNPSPTTSNHIKKEY